MSGLRDFVAGSDMCSGGADGAGPSNAGGAGPSAAADAAAPPAPADATYTQAQLMSKTMKDLQAILRAWKLPVGGRKDDLVSRIMQRQGRQ